MEIKGINLANQTISLQPISGVKNKTLTFDLNNANHGIGVRHIAEIIPPQDILKISDMPDFIGGTTIFRGKTVPILNLCSSPPEPCRLPTDNNCLIMVTVGDSTIGLLVDQIRGITQPSFSSRQTTSLYPQGDKS